MAWLLFIFGYFYGTNWHLYWPMGTWNLIDWVWVEYTKTLEMNEYRQYCADELMVNVFIFIVGITESLTFTTDCPMLPLIILWPLSVWNGSRFHSHCSDDTAVWFITAVRMKLTASQFCYQLLHDDIAGWVAKLWGATLLSVAVSQVCHVTAIGQLAKYESVNSDCITWSHRTNFSEVNVDCLLLLHEVPR
jgi:hypothetical protein